MRPSNWWPTAFAFVVACRGGTTNVEITEYDQSCNATEDCVVVKEGDICCGCPNAAINRKDLQRYEDDLGECEAQCDIGCVGTYVAFCDAGKCTIRNEDEQVCEPGEQVFCPCGAMTMDGQKTCLPDGSGFGDCLC